MPQTRPFFALDGLQLFQIVQQEIEQLVETAELGFKAKAQMLDRAVAVLSRDTRFEPHLTYPRGTYQVRVLLDLRAGLWQVEVTVNCPIHEPQEWTTTASGTLAVVQASPAMSRVETARLDPAPTTAPATAGATTIETTEGAAPQGDDMVDRRVQTHTEAGDPIGLETREFDVSMLPEAERLAIMAERDLMERRNARIIDEAKAAGMTELVVEGSLDKPNALRRTHGIEVPHRQRGEDGRSYDIGGQPAAETTGIEESI